MQNLRGSMDFLPSRILAPEGLSQLLAPTQARPPAYSPMRPISASFDKGHKNDKKKNRKPYKTTTTSTTQPPIVWFPGEPDCGETAPSSKTIFLTLFCP